MSHAQLPSRITLIAAAVFVSVTALLFYTHGNRFFFTFDEGIVLDAAERMLHGQTLYRDFFGIMTPGSYWIQEAVFALFGVTIRSGRIVVIIDFALQCAILFWLTALLAGKKAASLTTILFAPLQLENPEYLVAQHRMDSAALVLLSIALCVQGQRRVKPWYWAAGGLLATAAALCTPTVGLIAAVTLIWLCVDHSLRRFLLPYCGGLIGGTLAILAVLTASGLLKPMLDQLGWLSRNYTAVNYMPYGSITGGYASTLKGYAGIDLAIRAFLLFCTALPAVLPVAVIAAWAICCLREGQARRILQTPVPYLLGCMVFLVAGTYPRPDVFHLAFVAVLPYVLAATWMSWYAPQRLAYDVVIILSFPATVFGVYTARQLYAEVPVATAIGRVRVPPEDVDGTRGLIACVRSGDTLYVHPYGPILYTLTQANNPTRYSYVQPGLMTNDDAESALIDLKKKPPKAVMYREINRDDYLRVFPNAYNLNHLFPDIEDWIAREYVPVEPPVWIRGYRLYLRAAGISRPNSPSCMTAAQ